MAQEEQVLVVERALLEQEGMFQGVTFDVQKYLERLFAPGAARFMLRPLAENDPSFKQLIPYVIISYNGSFLSYVRGRRAGEARLVGQRSIGIGGHINPVDDMPLFADLSQTYLAAVEREVTEEISIEAGHTDHIVALLNDDSNAVGSVHLGIVHLWVLDAPKVERKEQMITQLAFLSLDQLRQVRDTMETWSGLCLDNLETMMQKVKKESLK